MATSANDRSRYWGCPVSRSGELTPAFISILADLYLDDEDNLPVPRDWKALAMRLIQGCKMKDIREIRRRSSSPTCEVFKRYFNTKSSIDVAFLWDLLHNVMGREDAAEELVRYHANGHLLIDPTQPSFYEQMSPSGCLPPACHCQQCLTHRSQALQTSGQDRGDAFGRQDAHDPCHFYSLQSSVRCTCQMHSDGCQMAIGPEMRDCLSSARPCMQWNSIAGFQGTQEEGTSYCSCTKCDSVQMPQEDNNTSSCYSSSSRRHHIASRNQVIHIHKVDDQTSTTDSETNVSRRQDSSWCSHDVRRSHTQRNGLERPSQHNLVEVRMREDGGVSSDYPLLEDITKRQQVDRDSIQRNCPQSDEVVKRRFSQASSGYPRSQPDVDSDLGTQPEGIMCGDVDAHSSNVSYAALSSSGRGSYGGSLPDQHFHLRAMIEQVPPRPSDGSSVVTIVTQSQRSAPVLAPQSSPVTRKRRVGITFHRLDSALAERLKKNLKEKGCRVTLLQGISVLKLRSMDAVVVVYSRHYREEISARTRLIGSAVRMVFNSLNLEYHDSERNKRVVFYPSFAISAGSRIHALFHHLPERRAAREVFDLLFVPREDVA